MRAAGDVQTGATYVDTTVPANNCSSCHPGNWAGWGTTQHSWAWPDLMNGTYHPNSCKPCHSTGAGQPSIYPSTGLDVATGLPTYLQNVTCQTCHGPASNHIAAPVSDTAAKLSTITLILNSSLCGSCHNAGGDISSSHHPTYDEWQLSGHNTSAAIKAAVGSNPSCSNCHDAWNEIQHIETGTMRTVLRSAGEDAPLTLQISCPVCHDPHSLGTSDPQLRLSPELLCPTCHNQQGAAPGKAVHHPQAEVRNNTAGYLADRTGLVYMPDIACSDCHMPLNNASLPNHTFDPNPWSCVQCHSSNFPDNATALAYIDMIAAKTVENITVVQPLVDNADSLVMQMAGNRSNVLSTYRNEYNISVYNLDTAVNDKSSGNHNPGLVWALLNDSRVRANSVIANLTPPDKITGITVTSPGEDKIEISWTATTATDFAKYRVYILTISETNITAETWVTELTDKTSVNYSVEGKQPGTYYVYVTAVDTNGNEITNTLVGKAVTLEAKEKAGISTELLAGIIILLAAIVIVTAAVMMRRRKGGEPKEPEKPEE